MARVALKAGVVGAIVSGFPSTLWTLLERGDPLEGGRALVAWDGPHENPQDLDYGLMIHTRFLVKTNNFSGYMVIVLGVNSLERLLEELKKWEERQAT